MNAVAKNLRSTRINAGHTQDDISQALHVTRQTVSSWEMGRSEPDIETLTALAEFLHVEVSELIYGPARPVYQPMQKKYKYWCIALGLIALSGVAAYFWLKPIIWTYKARHFSIRESMIYQLGLIPVCFAAAGALLPCLISLVKDTALKSPWRIFMLILGIALILPDLCSTLQLIMWDTSKNNTLYLWFSFIIPTDYRIAIWAHIAPFLSGIALFLGLNRSE